MNKKESFSSDSSFEGFIPKWANAGGQPTDSDEESDNEEVVVHAEKLLRQLTQNGNKSKTAGTDSDTDSDSISSDEARELHRRIDEGDYGEALEELDPEMKLTHEVADEAIRECCIKVAVVSMSANAALLLPGVGKTIGLFFGQAAAAGLIAKLQSDLITKLSDIYKAPISEGQKEKVHKLIAGVSEASMVAKKGVVLANTARKSLKSVSKTVATTSKSKYSRFIPVLGPLTMATVSMTSTFIIGKRCKAYYTKRLKLIADGGNVEEDEIKLESWNETIEMLTGVDKQNLSGMLNSAIDTSKNKMGSIAKSVSDYTNKGKSKFSSTYQYSKKNLNKAYDQGKKIVASGYTKGVKMVEKVRTPQKAESKNTASNASAEVAVAIAVKEI